MMSPMLSNPTGVDEVARTGYLVRFNNGATAFVFSDPMDWPLSAVHRIMCVTKMVFTPKPQPITLADRRGYWWQGASCYLG